MFNTTKRKELLFSKVEIDGNAIIFDDNTIVFDNKMGKIGGKMKTYDNLKVGFKAEKYKRKVVAFIQYDE